MAGVPASAQTSLYLWRLARALGTENHVVNLLGLLPTFGMRNSDFLVDIFDTLKNGKNLGITGTHITVGHEINKEHYITSFFKLCAETLNCSRKV